MPSTRTATSSYEYPNEASHIGMCEGSGLEGEPPSVEAPLEEVNEELHCATSEDQHPSSASDAPAHTLLLQSVSLVVAAAIDHDISIDLALTAAVMDAHCPSAFCLPPPLQGLHSMSSAVL
jgi:hypothetical protein